MTRKTRQSPMGDSPKVEASAVLAVIEAFPGARVILTSNAVQRAAKRLAEVRR